MFFRWEYWLQKIPFVPISACNLNTGHRNHNISDSNTLLFGFYLLYIEVLMYGCNRWLIWELMWLVDLKCKTILYLLIKLYSWYFIYRLQYTVLGKKDTVSRCLLCTFSWRVLPMSRKGTCIFLHSRWTWNGIIIHFFSYSWNEDSLLMKSFQWIFSEAG